ncbi:hypothetical protein HYT56_01595 [Candidatus Woesearchaeota archaeon]|nr:hypothetical protein [Candidatus Woesearchaeota archaeon]
MIDALLMMSPAIVAHQYGNVNYGFGTFEMGVDYSSLRNVDNLHENSLTPYLGDKTPVALALVKEFDLQANGAGVRTDNFGSTRYVDVSSREIIDSRDLAQRLNVFLGRTYGKSWGKQRHKIKLVPVREDGRSFEILM